MAVTFPLVKGTRVRLTKINGCGMPVSGPKNRLVTAGYVSLALTPVMKDAVDITQENAEGLTWFEDRTAPERRWWTAAWELTGVDPEAVTLLTGWPAILDAGGKVVGFQDDKTIESDFGVAMELWSSGKSTDDCADIPTLDAVLSAANASAKRYGYFLIGGTEWQPSDVRVSASVATLTLTGRSIPMPHWGRGPYNVASKADGTAQRLLTAKGRKEHLTVFRTAVAPPAPTDGAVALGTSTVFTGSNYYYGGPSSAPPIDVAPAQVA